MGYKVKGKDFEIVTGFFFFVIMCEKYYEMCRQERESIKERGRRDLLSLNKLLVITVT